MSEHRLPATLVNVISRQEGLVSRRQLLASGVSDEFARARVLAGRWQHVHRGVYATFNGPLGRTAQIWAALLRAG
ncbi:type IV toxin-antitoxin system AbiEi family antitoxin domain-containing protein, partial [Phytoactinopolyspora endophytica]|uniref:type IV toxin-antitoxin system AbiEi family antitoxin domain-containing protein n=1 Tax=Phytoactinopolyspora endophytica TaxID=1642495 RepID=UPI00197BADBE